MTWDESTEVGIILNSFTSVYDAFVPYFVSFSEEDYTIERLVYELFRYDNDTLFHSHMQKVNAFVAKISQSEHSDEIQTSPLGKFHGGGACRSSKGA